MNIIQEVATLYVYAYSWTPGFCDNQTYPGCLSAQDYWKNNLTIHGLWPQYSVSDYPSYCTTEPFDETIPLEIGWDTMTELWPDVQYNESDPNYDSFWEHEWTKHGTCSGLSQHDYFEAALNLTGLLTTPDILHESMGKTMNADSLRLALGGPDSVSLQCSKEQILTGVYTCWQKNEDGRPTIQIMCPDEVVNEDTCKKTENITILEL
tara:strand:- start:1989 stop:2612 length:624 start_codon:yes stop_codon:yes gene_type:complete